MATSWSASHHSRFALFVVGIIGLCLAVDALLAYGFAVFTVLSSGALNPYIGGFLVFVLPIVLAIGLTMVGWAWVRLQGEEAPREVAARGR